MITIITIINMIHIIYSYYIIGMILFDLVLICTFISGCNLLLGIWLLIAFCSFRCELTRV